MTDITIFTVYTVITLGVGYTAGHSFAAWYKGRELVSLRESNDQLFQRTQSQRERIVRQAAALGDQWARDHGYRPSQPGTTSGDVPAEDPPTAVMPDIEFLDVSQIRKRGTL